MRSKENRLKRELCQTSTLDIYKCLVGRRSLCKLHVIEVLQNEEEKLWIFELVLMVLSKSVTPLTKRDYDSPL